MSFSLEARNNGNVLIIRTQETLTRDDMVHMSNEIRTHCRQIEGTVHIVADMMATEQYPRNVVELKKVVTWTHESNLGWVVYLSNNHYLNVVLDAVMHMSGHSYLMLDNFDAALMIVSADVQTQISRQLGYKE
jgi:hypothetical protein